MDFINWKKEVDFLIAREYKLRIRPSLVEGYKYYRSNINPEDAASYLSNILHYKDSDF
jgi:hypothetical protein